VCEGSFFSTSSPTFVVGGVLDSSYSNRGDIILSELSQVQKVKITCSPSHTYYTTKTKEVILLDTGHTKERQHTGWIGQGKEIKNLNLVDVLTV
jgi:hypothetical protein